MTAKQRAYIQHRAAGLAQERAAIEAGYSRSSAKVSASRMERDPKIKEAIRAAREAARGGAGAPAEYEDPETYLAAVVRGVEAPDPVRVGAARAPLPYVQARKRAPKAAATPREMHNAGAHADEQALLDEWAEKAARVRARLKRS